MSEGTNEAARRRLNHIELVYRPGERELAGRVLSLLGCTVVDRGGTFFSAMVEPSVKDFVNNAIYASEVTPEQWALDQALIDALGRDDDLGGAASTYVERVRREPQRSFHFGIRFPELAQLESTIDAIAAAGADDPDLAGRIGVSGVFRPGDAGAYTDTMVQAFVRTDVVAAGLLALGQHVELQWHLPASG